MLHSTLQVRSDHDFLISRNESLIAESDGDFFQRVARSLDVVEIRKTSGEKTEAGDDEVEVPVNSCERIGRHHADDEVEDPVGCLVGSLANRSLEFEFGP